MRHATARRGGRRDRAALLDELLFAVWEWMRATRAASAAAAAPPSYRHRGHTVTATRSASDARARLHDTYRRVALEVARLDGHG